MISFPYECSDDDKLNMLFAYYKIDPIKIDDEDKPMIILALTQHDIDFVKIDKEGGLVIEYKDEEQHNLSKQ
jgi:hypothetical protein